MVYDRLLPRSVQQLQRESSLLESGFTLPYVAIKLGKGWSGTRPDAMAIRYAFASA